MSSIFFGFNKFNDIVLAKPLISKVLYTPMNDKLIINNKEFSSRLFLGTGKFSSSEIMKKALEFSGSEMVTVAVRRVNINNPEDNILSFIDKEKYLILPNTSGAYNAEEAVRIARIAKASGVSSWIKLEVTPEPKYLLPDGIETLKAAEILVKEGFTVLPYINADPILAKRLEEVGTATVMPLASPIGSNRGLKTKEAIAMIIEQANIPVVVDAGLGAPSDAAEAMEMGADAVLVNTAIAVAKNPAEMARAFKLGVEAGRLAYLSGKAEELSCASASSPLTGFLK
jgi:thiazole synthase